MCLKKAGIVEVGMTWRTITGLSRLLRAVNNETLFSGEFGDVYQGTLTRPDEEPILVAVKTLKVSSKVPLLSSSYGSARV